ncbi:MAG: hypothetical protein K0R39_3263 [Symbiobacteriaceae bacterium]|nr:hypothetical protein [Symbiobacteriaceae bacterium]
MLIDHDMTAQLSRAFLEKDYGTCLAMLNTLIPTSEGQEKVHWLRLRMQVRRHVEPTALSPLIEADLAEAFAAAGGDGATLVPLVLEQVLLTQQLHFLTLIPRTMLRTAWPSLAVNWRFQADLSSLHWLLRKWRKSYHARLRAIEIIASSPEEKARNGGWLTQIRTWCARSALRCGEADAAVQQLELSLTEQRRRKTPLPPASTALAKAELALFRGEYRAAQVEMTHLLGSLSEMPDVKTHAIVHIDLNLLAARVARAEGNSAGFDHFCARALAGCRENEMPLMKRHVYLMKDGAPF